jgi:hypothetical protein
MSSLTTLPPRPQNYKNKTYVLACENGIIKWIHEKNSPVDLINTRLKSQGVPEPNYQPPDPFIYTPKKYLFILAGQSNCQSKNNGPAIPYDQPHPNIFQYSRGKLNNLYNPGTNNTWIPAQNPLQHKLVYEKSVGFGLTFAKQLLASGKFNSQDKIYLLCCAVGGTGFKTISYDNNVTIYTWNKALHVNRNLYWETVSEANFILTQHKDMLLGGILWHQGESDIGMGNAYAEHLDDFIVSLRKDIHPANGDQQTIFICGTLLKSWKDLSPKTTSIIDKAHKTISRVWLADCAIFDHINGPEDKFDIVHFSAKAQREMGALYAAKYLEILKKKEEALIEWHKIHSSN